MMKALLIIAMIVSTTVAIATKTSTISGEEVKEEMMLVKIVWRTVTIMMQRMRNWCTF